VKLADVYTRIRVSGSSFLQIDVGEVEAVAVVLYFELVVFVEFDLADELSAKGFDRNAA
jgi:hypothetical protein